MNYIKLIKELKTDFSNNFYLNSPYLGICYAYDDKIIGTFKGDIWNKLTPFKKTPDKGTYREFYTNYMGISENVYTFQNDDLQGNRIIYVYPYMWLDDSVSPLYIWNLTRNNFYTRLPEAYSYFIDDTTYCLAEVRTIDKTEKNSYNCLSKWLKEEEIFTRKINKSFSFDPLIYPKISETYTIHKGRIFWFRIDTHLDHNRRIRFQISDDGNFSNLTWDSYVNIDNGDTITIPQYIEEPIGSSYPLYVRCRFEDLDGENPTSWASTIICSIENPQLYDYYTQYPGWKTYEYGDKINKFSVIFDCLITPYLNQYDSTKIHIQVADDTSFNNSTDISQDITFDSLYQQQSFHFSRKIFYNDTDLTLYFRCRAENSDGSEYSDWSPIITFSFDSPSNQSITYTKYPSDYTGVSIQNLFQGLTKRDSYFDILRQSYIDTVTNGSATIANKYYIDTVNASGLLISSKYVYTRTGTNIPIPIQIRTIGNETFILDMDSNYLTLRVFKFDGTNITGKTISVPEGFAGFDYCILQKNKKVIFTASDENWENFTAFRWDWESENIEELNLPMGIYNQLSNTSDSDGFWFEFDDGTYCGIAFAYEEGISYRLPIWGRIRRVQEV